MKALKLAVVSAAVVLFADLAYGRDYAVASPDSRIGFAVHTDGELGYSLSFGGKQLIARSKLGFEFANEEPMSKGFAVVGDPKIEKGLVEAWKPVVRNKHADVRQVYNRMVLPLRETWGRRRRMDFTVNLYDDGVAFRYTLYGGERPQERLIKEELTEYRVPESSFAWVGFNADKGFTGSQESRFEKTPVTRIAPDAWCLTPLLVEVDRGNYLALASACLDNYPGYLAAYRGGAIVTRLVPTVVEGEHGVKARFEGRFDTAWRVIFVGDNPGRFIESEIIHALNPPCAIADTSWIKPGISAWDHWWSGEVKMEMGEIKRYIDLAAEEGWPYMLIDWQWYGPFNVPEADITKPAPQIDMPEIMRYAKSKNVRIWLWLYCADANLNDAYVEAFRLYHEWGAVGVKIDFMDRYDRDCVNWYRKIVKCAAENELMVDFHGAFAPDGLDRTYPNQLTREGVEGEEYSKFSQDITPDHNVTLAFTRMLAGHMDYTPGGFNNEAQGGHACGSPTKVMNTRCAELSKFVVYDSPWCVFCDHPDFVLGKPGADFLKTVPTVWDDTRFLGGYPGEWVALAKRDGKRWFVGVMGGVESRDVELDLSSLGCGGAVESWTDGDKPTELVHARGTLKDGKLSVRLAPGGGAVAIVTADF